MDRFYFVAAIDEYTGKTKWYECVWICSYCEKEIIIRENNREDFRVGPDTLEGLEVPLCPSCKYLVSRKWEYRTGERPPAETRECNPFRILYGSTPVTNK
jgi:hypothetical protein